MEVNKIYNQNCLEGLKKLPDNSVDCCVTSPPYFGLRDYGHADQIGLEETPELFVAKMVEVFTEVKRVLKKEGTLWLNLGDSYGGSGRGSGDTKKTSEMQRNHSASYVGDVHKPFISESVKPKDLIGIPWLTAFALRGAGWYLRQDIIWSKPNPMPESVTDRCTKSHEYIFLLSKSQKYFFDADSIREKRTSDEDANTFRGGAYTNGNIINSELGKRKVVGNKKIKIPGGWDLGAGAHGTIHRTGRTEAEYQLAEIKDGRNKRSVWTISPQPFPEAHFATFPEDLIVDCIKAGCPENGIVLDPFMGAGTTALVSRKLNRNFIGFELNCDYINIAENRLRKELGMFHHDNIKKLAS